MTTLLDQVDQLAEQLNELLPMKPEDKQRLDKKFRLEFNYNSNHMEGNTLTYGETELLLIFDDTKGNHTMREYEEMKAHDAAYHLVEQWSQDKERPLTEQSIKNLNEIILVRPFWKDAMTQDGQLTRRLIKVGNYKEHPNSVRLQNGELFHYASPIDTPIQMQELIDWYRLEQGTLHPITLAAMLHYKFVIIHPFDDGNGRVSRLLMNYVLLQNGLPPVIIKSLDKTNYLRALNRADTGEYEAFINYVAEQVIWSLQMSIKAANGESIEESNDWKKKLQVLKAKTFDSEQIKKVRSDEGVKEILVKSVLPLIKALILGLAQFDELFSRKKLYIFQESSGRPYEDFDSISDYLIRNIDQIGHRFSFRYELDGFNRNGKNPFPSSGKIYWYFDDYMYYTSVNSDDYTHRIKHLYDEYYSTEEIDSYVSECANEILAMIDRQLNRNVE